MSDEVDLANNNAALVVDADIQAVRNRAAQIPVGIPGECDKCGEDSLRLVGGCCARCRDKFRLP